MPELPEVETVIADLRPQLVGRTIVEGELRHPSLLRYPTSAAFLVGIGGRRILALSRHGKYIFHHLEDGGRLVVHLGMSGQLSVVPAETTEPNHLHVVFQLDDGLQLRYRDPRRFGRLLLGREEELLESGHLPRLGADALDPTFTAAELHRLMRGRRTALKVFLLDQRAVAGIGNIYADEACYLAGLRPTRPAESVSRPAAERLHTALREVLQEAIANRGSTIRSYRDAYDEMGRHQERLWVYGRGGEACLACGGLLSQIRVVGRSTVFCSRCQR
ncbi:MAG: bifunctional DNA-formamidopyrimidine glycosylase/DNA-(apurinic or apyrimidinic site) lyase [Candidatus Dormibacteraceae bacterium]